MSMSASAAMRPSGWPAWTRSRCGRPDGGLLIRRQRAASAPCRWQQDGQRLPGYWVPAAQVPDRLAVLPLDGVFEQVGQPPAAGDAGDVGDPAAGPDRDDEPLVVEGERLQRPAPQLRVQIAG